MPTATATRERESKVRATNTTGEERRWLEQNRDELSGSTLRAKWIHGPADKPDRKGQTLATRDPDVIRRWAEARRGMPAAATRDASGRPRTLRIDFPGGGSLDHVEWNEWLRVFEERELVFLYQEQRRDGSQSNFFRLDSPGRERS
jgi:hypothetical protein